MNSKRVASVITALLLVLVMLPVAVSADINMSLSKKGADFIKGYEGFSAKAFWDYQQWTIGYGSKWDSKKYPEGDPDDKTTPGITKAQADEMFNGDISTYIGFVNTFLIKIKRTVTQNQFDALVSFTYNLGNVWETYIDENGKKVFQLKTILTNGIENYTAAQIKTAFGNWCKAGGAVVEGLVLRRAAEAEMFLTPDAPEPTTTAAITTAPLYEVWKVNAKSGLYLRSGPEKTYASVGVIPLDAVINITEKVEGTEHIWGKTSYNGTEGWCALTYADYVSGSLVPPTTTEATQSTGLTDTQTATATGETGTGTTVETGTGTTIETTIDGISTEPFTSETTVTEPTTIVIGYGDVNEDGGVDAKDILLLKQYLAKWGVTIGLPWSDCNVDSLVNAKDLLLLRKFIAEWDVELGKQQPTVTTTEPTTVGPVEPTTDELPTGTTPPEPTIPTTEELTTGEQATAEQTTAELTTTTTLPEGVTT